MDERVARELLGQARSAAQQRLRDLGASFEDIVEASRDSNGDDEHDSEGVTVAATRAQVAALIAADRRKIEEIERATQSLNAGTYGRCVKCGTRIPDRRLEARPATPWCVDCARG
ncbi:MULTISPECIES: TraR/DksA family transcriptional regulator [Dermacoccus]|uniref:TraR/DksA C4-type zinc finger protein n=1 Tax=Dermacoccus profundi TaxID=322602 RepID=A0ABN2D7K7_9MICO